MKTGPLSKPCLAKKRAPNSQREGPSSDIRVARELRMVVESIPRAAFLTMSIMGSSAANMGGKAMGGCVYKYI